MVHLKSPSEVEMLRRAGDLVSRTLGAVAEHISPGTTTARLDEIAETFIRDNNAEPAFKGYVVAGNTYPTTLCISVNDAIVHGIPGDYELRDGDVVSVDCGVVIDGYYGDCAYTFGVGELTEPSRELCRVTYESLLAAIGRSVAGSRIGDISSTVQSYCESRGFGVVKDLVGHGIGRRLHEDPQVPNVGSPGTGKKLRRGMTLCIEPMINAGTAAVATDSDRWTVRTEDGLPSAHYEHMIAIGDPQPDVLTTYEYIEAVVTPPYEHEVTLGDG